MIRTERTLIRRFRNLLAVTPALAEKVARIAPRSAVTVVPLTLDLDRYDFIPLDKAPADPVVAMIGSMDWPSSKYAAERLLRCLWPKIKENLPNARLQITGRGARRSLPEYLNLPGVEICEDVASMRPYFEKAALMLYAPESGSGMKVKVLEAFAYGLPVVTTPAGVDGLEAEDGVHAGVCSADPGLIERALKLLYDPVRRQTQRQAARRLMETRYSPVSVMERLERSYTDVLARRASPETEVLEQYADRC
jgi:glycosyltransferase involved in cell wall biosynthesis